MSKKLLNRKNPDPNKFIFTGTGNPEHIAIQLFKFNTENYMESSNIQTDKVEKLYDNEFQYWLNIHGIHEPDTIVSICKKLGIDNLVIQDILDVNQRPKFQEYEDYSFFTIKSISPSKIDNIQIDQISFIFGKNYVVSFQERKADYFEHIRYRIRENTGIIRERGSDYVLYLMLEAVLDNYFKTLQLLEKNIDDFEVIDLDQEPLPSLLKTYEHYRKQIHLIKKTINPIKEFTLLIEKEGNELIEERHIKYFFELKDLCMTLIDNCETIDSTLESNINLFFSVQGHRMNQIMKTLTITATTFIPLTFIVGIYGMNFRNMPEIRWKYGYAAVWVFILTVLIIMLSYFKRKKWF